jgi:FKBP-type peptidyl-prolyl cis-trans isomerase FkpA
MIKLNTRIKICALAMFAIVVVSGCKKAADTYTPEKEASEIANWLDTMVKNNSNIDTTSTGLFYIVDKAGAGATVKSGDAVTVQYTGKFLDGTVFDSSSSFSYVHKAAGQRMIQGWEEGIEVMKKGESAVFLIPSAKAYGNDGNSVIPPYTPLIFVIGIIDIK